MKTPLPMEPLAVSPERAAELTNLGINLVRHLIAENRFPHVPVGGRKVIVPVDMLREWLRAQAERGIPLL